MTSPDVHPLPGDEIERMHALEHNLFLGSVATALAEQGVKVNIRGPKGENGLIIDSDYRQLEAAIPTASVQEKIPVESRDERLAA